MSAVTRLDWVEKVGTDGSLDLHVYAAATPITRGLYIITITLDINRDWSGFPSGTVKVWAGHDKSDPLGPWVWTCPERHVRDYGKTLKDTMQKAGRFVAADFALWKYGLTLQANLA